jgi:hypothetical protein
MRWALRQSAMKTAGPLRQISGVLRKDRPEQFSSLIRAIRVNSELYSGWVDALYRNGL